MSGKNARCSGEPANSGRALRRRAGRASAGFALAPLVLLLCASTGATHDNDPDRTIGISIDGQAPVTVAAPAAAAVLTTLYRFPGGKNGDFPRGGVAMDDAGNIYGTTLYDGNCSTCGTFYLLKPPVSPATAWTHSVLHQFGKTLKDGIAPTAPLTIKNGVIFGTTSAGADPSCGCGEVFKIDPASASKAQPAYTILHRFSKRPLGSTPIGGLLIDADDTMYGTTSAGGKHGSGTIFKLTGAGGFTDLHDFAGNFNGGPQGELIFGKDGKIYGTTFGGGKYNQGVIFRIAKGGGGYTVLYDFKGVNQPGGSHDGAQPEGRLALGKDGTIYGTTTFGGSPSGYGTAWSLKPGTTAQNSTYKQLHIFGSDGNLPHTGFVMDNKGVLYGTGSGGGHFQDGVVYKLVPPASGNNWKYVVLHSFKGRNKDGNIPSGGLLLRQGALYGSNLSGGKITNSGDCQDGCGTVYKLKL